MVASLVQSAAAASTVNGPASVTPTLGGGSTQGNLLLLVVAVSSSAGGNPTITTPANWTLISSSNGSNNATAVFARPLNPGGITSVAVTVNATNGGAVGALFEYSGLGNSIFGQTPEYSNNLNGAGTGLGNVFSQQQVAYIQELNFVAVGFFVATLTPITTGEFGSNLIPANNQSSGATNNIRLEVYQGFNPGPTTPFFACSFSSGGGAASVGVRYPGIGYIGRGVGGAVMPLGQQLLNVSTSNG